MATSAGTIGFGVTLGYSADGTSYTTLGELVDCDVPEIVAGKVKMTSHQTTGDFHEYKPSPLKEVSDCSFVLAMIKAEMTALEALVGVVKQWKVTIPGIGDWKWSGFISKIGGASVPSDEPERVELPATITATGAIDFTAAT